MTIIEEVIFFLKSNMHFKRLYSLPVEKSIDLFWTNLNPFTHENFVPSLVKICTMILKKKNVKSLKTDKQTDDGQ